MCIGAGMIVFLPNLFFLNLSLNEEFTEERKETIVQFYDLPLIGKYIKRGMHGRALNLLARLKLYTGNYFEAIFLSLFEALIYLAAAVWTEANIDEILSIIQYFAHEYIEYSFIYDLAFIPVCLLWLKVLFTTLIFCDGLSNKLNLYLKIWSLTKGFYSGLAKLMIHFFSHSFTGILLLC